MPNGDDGDDDDDISIYFIWHNNLKFKTEDNKIVSGFIQTQYNFIVILTTCFGQLSIIRPSLQNLELGVCSAHSIHIFKVLWDPILSECYFHCMHFKFCKDGLMKVN